MTPAPEARRLPSWIESFVSYTGGTQSPELFRRWGAVATIAGALERKVWVSLRGWQRDLYPNLYTLLVGGPGIGKTDALRGVRSFWETLPNLHVAPTSVSRASLADKLSEAARAILNPVTGEFTRFNSLQVCAEEFGTFLSKYETEFMSTLNHVYDNIKYEESKRGMKDDIVIPNAQINIIAATTPTWLGANLPDTAWSEGFSSRVMLIFSAEKIRVDPFAANAKSAALNEDLEADLAAIHNLHGPFLFDDEFVVLFRSWYMEGCPPAPEHPKLEHYLPRRHTHFLKLCMILSASRSSEMILRKEDFFAAMDLLIDTEAQMPEVFKAIKYNSDSNVIDEVYAYVWQAYMKEKKPVSVHRIYRFIAERAPSYAVEHILTSMVKSRMLIVEAVGSEGMHLYRPAPKASF